jgi:4-carboxymuconolactone decarboxylase
MFQRGAEIRREVLGMELNAPPRGAEAFAREFSDMAVAWCWGDAWARPGLDRRTRSIATLAMLTALGKLEEIKVHVRGALRNGATPEEIREIIMHATVYAGVPAGGGAFQAALSVLVAEGVFAKEVA